MSAATVRQLKRRPAKRPASRTVDVTLGGDYAGWEATCRADFPAKLIADLQAGSLDRIIAALDAIVIDHNFPNDADEIAATLAEVDYVALGMLAQELTDALAKLPNR